MSHNLLHQSIQYQRSNVEVRNEAAIREAYLNYLFEIQMLKAVLILFPNGDLQLFIRVINTQLIDAIKADKTKLILL